MDFINTVNMVVGLTVEIILKWKDHKINYENIKNFKEEEDSFRIIPSEEKDKIWLPLPELVHDNAIIGETKVVDLFMIGVEVKNDPMLMDSGIPRETLIYPGKENILVVSQRLKLKYRCEFFLVHFPFDDTTCDFYLSIRTIGNNSIRMTSDDNSVIYDGPHTLNEFEIINFWSKTAHSDTKTSFIYTFEFARLYRQHLMTTFFQSFLLWVLAYITLFINEDDFSNRFMGAVTSLLVLAALLSSIGDLLPKTAYFKFVDLWFNWFIANIFLIIVIHVLVDYFNNTDKAQTEVDDKSNTFKCSQVSPPTPKPILFNKLTISYQVEGKQRIGAKLNNFFKIVIPVMT